MAMAPAAAPIRNLLTSFSPASDFLALSSGDGRIKVWDAMRGHLQTEFADIPAVEAGALPEAKRGNLALDYTCMKWVQLSSKQKKRKARSSLLVLGTGSGDVLALDVAAGRWKWRISDCHPGGTTVVAYSRHGRSMYTTGADGLVCKIDASDGSIVGKFRSSSKAISALAVSSGTITALDRANAEDAILPLPKLHTQEKKRKHGVTNLSGDIKPASHSDLGTTTRLIEKRGLMTMSL